jgi:DNA repair exonuclease SbcCD ATPase subunit
MKQINKVRKLRSSLAEFFAVLIHFPSNKVRLRPENKGGNEVSENTQNKNSRLLKIGIGIAVMIFLIAAYFIGNSTAAVKLEGQKVKYEKLTGKLADKENELAEKSEEVKNREAELNQVKKEIESKTDTLESKKKEYSEAIAIISEKEKVQEEIKHSSENLDAAKAEAAKLKKEIDAKKLELASIEGKIIEKKEAPKTLSAGQYIVGKDLQAGRYKAVPNGEGSNFFVYDSSGMAAVNTILGNDSFSVPEYVFFCDDGNVIETMAPVKLIPVE